MPDPKPEYETNPAAAENPAPEKAPTPKTAPARKEPKASTSAQVFRENDLMRLTIDARVLDITAGTMSLRVTAALQVADQIKIRLRNIVQRLEKEVRGRVCAVEPREDESFDLAVDLLTRLTPLEVSTLKMGILPPDADASPKWI